VLGRILLIIACVAIPVSCSSTKHDKIDADKQIGDELETTLRKTPAESEVEEWEWFPGLPPRSEWNWEVTLTLADSSMVYGLFVDATDDSVTIQPVMWAIPSDTTAGRVVESNRTGEEVREVTIPRSEIISSEYRLFDPFEGMTLDLDLAPISCS